MQNQLTCSVMRVIIVEDEAPARNKLARQLAQLEEVELIAQCADPLLAIRQINALKPDVVLLDIELGELSGFEVMDAIEHPCHVIFTTAYSQYAVAAFEKRALDYLLKPFNLERLQEAFTRAAIWRGYQKEPARTQVMVKVGDKAYLIHVDDIRYVNTANGVAMITCSERTYHVNDSLESLATKLPLCFLRVHRNCIINSHHLSNIEKWKNETLLLRFEGVNQTVTTSRRGAAALRQYLKA